MEPTRPAGPDFDLQAYEDEGCQIFAGYLGRMPVSIIVTPHAQRRMLERDVDDEELLSLLSLPESSHGRGTSASRREVAGAIDRRDLRAIYERPHKSIVKVITVFLDQ